ncbi:hypothetical protein ACJX0J_008784 [Zea mays]
MNMLTIHPWIVKYYFDEHAKHLGRVWLHLAQRELEMVNAEHVEETIPYTQITSCRFFCRCLLGANNFAYVKIIHGTKTNNINYCEIHNGMQLHRRHGSIIMIYVPMKNYF